VRFIDAMRSLGRPRNIGEALRAFRAQHGKGASRALADRLGVSLRQAQRYLRGDIKRPPVEKERAIRDSADRRVIASNALTGARTVSVGRVGVVDSRGKRSTRPAGTLVVDDQMRAALAEAARLHEQGDDRGAEAAMGAAIMGGYSRASRDNRTIAPGALSVTDYPDGLDVG
jgi:transcriptional regulator with XRE-family HTH domain